MTPEQRQIRNAKRRKKYEPEEPKGVMGEVPYLIPGEVNPMWEMTKSVKDFSKIAADILNATTPKKIKKRIVMSKDGWNVVQKEVEDDTMEI